MHYEKYENVDVSTDELEYEFISTGKNTGVRKLIQFTATNIIGLYNLALLDIQDDGTFSDSTVSNNGDRNKILATVYSAVYKFTIKFPEKWIFFAGNTPNRTRLYRMAITINWEYLSNNFEIMGVHNNAGTVIIATFEKNVNYSGFLFKKRF